MTRAPAPEGLAQALTELSGSCDDGVESLLSTFPVAGDRSGQAALDGCLDAALDALRMLSAAARDAAAQFPPPTTGPRDERAGHPRGDGAQRVGEGGPGYGWERAGWPS